MVDKALIQYAVEEAVVAGASVHHPQRHAGKGSGGENQLNDAIARLLDEERVLAYRFEGKWFDCDSKLGYLLASLEYALNHPELSED